MRYLDDMRMNVVTTVLKTLGSVVVNMVQGGNVSAHLFLTILVNTHVLRSTPFGITNW